MLILVEPCELPNVFTVPDSPYTIHDYTRDDLQGFFWKRVIRSIQAGDYHFDGDVDKLIKLEYESEHRPELWEDFNNTLSCNDSLGNETETRLTEELQQRSKTRVITTQHMKPIPQSIMHPVPSIAHHFPSSVPGAVHQPTAPQTESHQSQTSACTCGGKIKELCQVTDNLTASIQRIESVVIDDLSARLKRLENLETSAKEKSCKENKRTRSSNSITLPISCSHHSDICMFDLEPHQASTPISGYGSLQSEAQSHHIDSDEENCASCTVK